MMPFIWNRDRGDSGPLRFNAQGGLNSLKTSVMAPAEYADIPALNKSSAALKTSSICVERLREMSGHMTSSLLENTPLQQIVFGLIS